jgi:uncharacterized protein (DUF1778 family)
MAAKASKTKMIPGRTAKSTASAAANRRQARTSRFEARLTAEIKTLFQQAASLRGETVTDFVLAASREKALETLQEAQLVRLTAEDQERFAEALLNPWDASERLRNAADRYRRTIG